LILKELRTVTFRNGDLLQIFHLTLLLEFRDLDSQEFSAGDSPVFLRATSSSTPTSVVAATDVDISNQRGVPTPSTSVVTPTDVVISNQRNKAKALRLLTHRALSQVT
jgi:hypothetical protein